MDVLYFLKKRTAFIRQFYEVAAGPYLERKRKIEGGEEPYEQPYYNEYSSGEPAYLEDWMETDESLHVLAYSCVSMLAAALHLYFITWEKQLGIPVGDTFKAEFKKGWFAGYQAYLAHYIGVNFVNCPANMELLKEVVIARNRVQHPESSVEHFGAITNIKPQYSVADLQKLSRPVFLDEDDRKLLAEVDEAVSSWFMPPTLHLTRENLIAAINETDKFCDWLEEQLTNVHYRR